MRLFLTFALLLSLWWAKAQIIPLTISGAEDKLDWKAAMSHCWDEYQVSGFHPRVNACVRAFVRAYIRPIQHVQSIALIS